MEQPKVYIIIVNYKNWEDTILCLDSLLNINYTNYEVVVVDNNSPDDSVEKIKFWMNGKLMPWMPPTNPFIKKLLTRKYNSKIFTQQTLEVFKKKVTKISQNNISYSLIESDKNKGFSAGNNIGIKYALNNEDGKYIWLLNNDAVAHPDSLYYLVERMEGEKERNSKTGIIGLKIYNFERPEVIQSVGGRYNKCLAVGKPIGGEEIDTGQYNLKNIEQDYIIGASMFVNINFIHEIGLMNEEYFLFFEELDWIERGKRKNWEIAYEYKSKIYHKSGASTSLNRNKKGGINDIYQIRNRILFTKKFYPFCLPIVYLSMIVTIFNRIRRKQYKMILTILKILTLGANATNR